MSPQRKFKLTIEYDGANFCGWQTQAPGFRTVQEHLEQQLAKIFKVKINCLASGRTDSGVHALAQVAHFQTHTSLSPEVIHKALNANLDRDVSIVSVEEVPLSFNAQVAKEKTYRYTILNRDAPSALWRSRAYYYPEKLDIASMKEASIYLIGKHDFKSFQNASERSKTRTTVRQIKKLVIKKERDLIHITVTGDGFLYKMVRNIVSALIAIGSGRIPKESMLKILNGKSRQLSGLTTAPSHGLCLISVKYQPGIKNNFHANK